MTDVSFITYSGLPDLDPDDRSAADELARRGVTVAAAVWDDPRIDWSAAGTCIIRSAWDYHLKPRAFCAWARRVASLQTLFNPLDMVEWNMDKSYLLDLEHRGVPIVPTVCMSRVTRRPLFELMRERDWPHIVVKPAVGLATFGVRTVDRGGGDLTTAEAHVDELLGRSDVLVQPYMNSVSTTAERALVFIDNEYSHAVSKTAFQPLLAAGEAGEMRVEASAHEISVAAQALLSLQRHLLYSRVDLVRDEAGAPRVLELELIEPSLFFGMKSSAAKRFADAVCRHLKRAP